MKVDCIEEGTFPNLSLAYLIRPCYHCENPPCIQNCPVGAIRKSAQNGIVLVKREVCLGLKKCGGMCKESCPYDAPQFSDEDDAKMQKCELCFDRWQQGKKPICVEGCPMRALDAGPLDELVRKYGDPEAASGVVSDSDIKASIVIKKKRKYLNFTRTH